MIKHLRIARSMALFCAVFSWLSAVPSFAQTPAQGDTLLIKFGKKSALSLVLADDQDLSILPEIDFNRMVDSLAYYLQLAKQRDLSYLAVQGKVADYAIRVNTSPAPPTKPKNIVQITSELFKEKSDDHELRRTQSGFSLSFGFNNVLENGKVPTRTAYDLRPMGSRYVDVGYRGFTYLTGKRHLYKKGFGIKYGVMIPFYNFMFENDQRLVLDQGQPTFITETFPLEKSKLTAAYLTAPLTFHYRFNKHWQIGAGPFVGYRLFSYTKIKYRQDGETERRRQNDHFGLNPVQYGLRVELGIDELKLFATYQMKPLFEAPNMPELNAFAFGFRL